MPDLDPFLRFWRALDGLFDAEERTSWGAVVADARYPAVQEANYARVEAIPPVRLAEVETTLLPALARSGSRREHVVVFFPEEQTDLLVEASIRGDKIVWDLVMAHDGALEASPDPDSDPGGPVEEVRDAAPWFWTAHRASTRLFDVSDEEMLDQLAAIERDVLLPAGRRWFVVPGSNGFPVAFAALLVLEGVGFLDHVVTLPEARRRGHATALTRRVLAEAVTAGAGRTYLLAEPRGHAGHLYERLGFERVTQIASWVSPLERVQTRPSPER
ncbi:MAG: GNAT family N-acetyltransferase [Actinomycetota bacterium]